MKTLRTPKKQTSARSRMAERLYRQIIAAGLPTPEKEYRFHPLRKWRFDFMFLEPAIGVEYEGAVFSPRGRHTRGPGFKADTDKYNAAVLLGWRVLRFTEKQVIDGSAVSTIRAALAWTGELPRDFRAGD